MQLVIPACHKDINGVLKLVDWMHELKSDYSSHSALVVTGALLDAAMAFQLGEMVRLCGFRNVTTIKLREENPIPWPNAANEMWKTAAQWMQDAGKTPWLWLEGDAIPIRDGWLDVIVSEYLSARKPYLGTIYDLPWRHLNGIAVYPENVRKYNPLTFNDAFQSLPFDTVRPDLILPRSHITRLIFRSLADPSKNLPHSFESYQQVKNLIPADCVLAHCCKDGSLIDRLREHKTGNKTSPRAISAPKTGNPESPGIFTMLRRKVAVAINGANTYLHAGNLGDVIYSLPAIKALGGGDLIISPEQRKTAVCSVPINQEQFDIFKPLLDQQTYLRSVKFSQKYPSGTVIDLNQFRSIWIQPSLKKQEGIDTLCKAHFWTLDIMDKFDDDETWLQVKDPIVTDKIIIHRSPRYQSNDFPWARLVSERQKDLLFVGLKSEHTAFEKAFGAVGFWMVNDLLEMARLIAGSRCFIGNQSSPLSIAIGLGRRVICEECKASPDCRFHRDSYTGHLMVGADKLNFKNI